MTQGPKRPKFFIVGGPKCGTTALQSYLSAAPDVFMPDAKEFNHFADDLLAPDDEFASRERYLSLFEAAGPGQLTGEASVYHMLSGNAAKNIHEFDPEAKIIAMLRNPVDVLPALHSQLVFNGDEPLEDFCRALKAEPRRRRGESVPEGLRFPQKLWYAATVSFAEQLERFLKHFPDMRVIVYDDFAKNTAKVYREVLIYLGADPDFRPIFRVVNANKKVRSRRLRAFLQSSDSAIKQAGRMVAPKPLRGAVASLLRHLNTRRAPRPPLSCEVRRRLQAEWAGEVGRLGELLKRDLSYWVKDAKP